GGPRSLEHQLRLNPESGGCFAMASDEKRKASSCRHHREFQSPRVVEMSERAGPRVACKSEPAHVQRVPFLPRALVGHELFGDGGARDRCAMASLEKWVRYAVRYCCLHGPDLLVEVR